MPTFTGYPALQVRAPDVWGAMQQGAESAQINQLRQIQIQNEMNPQADPRLALDREKFEFSKDKDQRAQALEKIQQIGSLLAPFADKAVPEIQKAQMWPQMLQQAQAMGLPVDKAPQQYDPQWVAMTMGQAGQYVSQAKDAEKAFTLSPGQRRYGPSGREIASLPESADGGKAPKGLSTGEAYNALLEYKSYVDAGESPPAGVTSRASAAAHVLETKQYRRDAQDRLVSFTPGIPEGFAVPGRRKTSAEAGGGAKPRGLTVEQGKVDVNKPLSTMQEIVALLNDPANQGGFGEVTGVVGTAKRLGGGLARQAGIPVSEAASNLHRLLLTLQGQMGPIILNEKRLSGPERKRLEDIVGSVTPTMDIVEMRAALASLYDFIEKYSE